MQQHKKLSATAESILYLLGNNERLGKAVCAEQPSAVAELRESGHLNENGDLIQSSDYAKQFEEFWASYPSGPKGYYPKDKKPKCRSVYIEKLKKGVIVHEQMMLFMRNYVRYREHVAQLQLSDPKVFLPNPKYTSTFLNNIEAILEQYQDFLDPNYDPANGHLATTFGPSPTFL